MLGLGCTPEPALGTAINTLETAGRPCRGSVPPLGLLSRMAGRSCHRKLKDTREFTHLGHNTQFEYYSSFLVRHHLWISVIRSKSVQLYLCIPYQCWVITESEQCRGKPKLIQRLKPLWDGRGNKILRQVCGLSQVVFCCLPSMSCYKFTADTAGNIARHHFQKLQTLLKHYLKLLAAECWGGSATAAHEIINSEDNKCLKSNQWLIHNHIVCFVKQTDFT